MYIVRVYLCIFSTDSRPTQVGTKPWHRGRGSPECRRQRSRSWQQRLKGEAMHGESTAFIGVESKPRARSVSHAGCQKNATDSDGGDGLGSEVRAKQFLSTEVQNRSVRMRSIHHEEVASAIESRVRKEYEDLPRWRRRSGMNAAHHSPCP
jgi:hypothetical protein